MSQPTNAPAQSSLSIRDAILAPVSTAHSGLNNPFELIRFRHPGYPGAFGQDILFSLYPFDSSTGGGLQYGVAFSACAIVAGNAWTGWLTETRDGARLIREWDDLLFGTDYYFHVSQDPLPEDLHSGRFQYPIVPTFRHWTFPHDQFPDQWHGPRTGVGVTNDAIRPPPPLPSNATNYVHNRDKGCVISKYRDDPERAHICPRSEIEWFLDNRMEQYNLKVNLDPVIDDAANSCSMRSDLHTAFDVSKKFVITPKSSRWIVHFLEPTMDMGNLYHNVPLDLDPTISPKFILSRFAWAIFPRLAPFLKTNSFKSVKVRVTGDDGMEEKVETMSGADLTKLLDSSKSRTSSLIKKRRQGTSERDDLGEYSDRGRKRFRVSQDNRADWSTANTSPNYDSDMNSSRVSPSGVPKGGQQGPYDFKVLKRKILLAQRPKDPQLVCCDYNAAEDANRRGLEGPRAKGGAHLCLECLGLEYRDDAL